MDNEAIQNENKINGFPEIYDLSEWWIQSESSSSLKPLRDIIKLDDENIYGLSVFLKIFNRQNYDNFQTNSKKQRKSF